MRRTIPPLPRTPTISKPRRSPSYFKMPQLPVVEARAATVSTPPYSVLLLLLLLLLRRPQLLLLMRQMLMLLLLLLLLLLLPSAPHKH